MQEIHIPNYMQLEIEGKARTVVFTIPYYLLENWLTVHISYELQPIYQHDGILWTDF